MMRFFETKRIAPTAADDVYVNAQTQAQNDALWLADLTEGDILWTPIEKHQGFNCSGYSYKTTLANGVSYYLMPKLPIDYSMPTHPWSLYRQDNPESKAIIQKRFQNVKHIPGWQFLEPMAAEPTRPSGPGGIC